MTQTPSRALWALLLAAGFAIAAPAAQAADAKPAADAASAPAASVRPETGPLIKAAIDLQAAKDWVGVLAKVKEVEAVGNLNPYERYLVARSRAIAAYYVKDYASAVAAFRTAIDSEFLPATDKVLFLEVLFQIDVDQKQYDAAVALIDEYRKAGGTKAEILDDAGQLLYQKGDNKGAAASFQKQIDADIAAGKTPPERLLRMQVGAQQAADDDEGLGRTAQLIARYYPKRDVWMDVVQRTNSAPGVDKLRLDALRMRATILGYADKEGSAQLTHAYLAARGGYPAEAQGLFDDAIARKIVPAAEAAEVAKSRESVVKTHNNEKATDKATESGAKSAKDGEGLASYGLELFFDGQAERGIAMMEAGIAKGVKRPDEAKLHLGMALLRAGRTDDARKTFESITAKDGAGALAKVYLLWIQSGMKMLDAPKAG